MMTKKELEQYLAKLEDFVPKVSAKKSKRPGRPKKYDDRLVLFLIALREKYGWSLRDLEKKAKDIVPKGIEVPDFSSIHYRIRSMREYIEEIKPKLLKIIPDIEDQKADSNTKKSRRPKSTKTTRK
ncbi:MULTISPECIES: helix-turn-helix domain-containing protein [unclassified Hydrogenobaculum]|jgi:hypothetical protein|uniref:helix-turn-helix domain-containing protein n=1 Tax=unclassified Hydrogenobaculum TaxID=2622382 RepID=UPI0001C50329|nr:MULTISPECIES: helix-turn-helix domain-containing protein [unclassified Hydrogenobaculum]AEF18600.1 hypothetical protein Hyd3684_0193 [Hydrogenobaculum sp. 3684]AEG45888.1 hypothetical protein HydSHO_0193 [Hydrogenobaculum sp. SHO]AGG14531.1 hypothetical protein HydHO_0194 [Hydrogenobaculum sp. HO]AGH92832.1 hypothetical protein HydSN_0201 [Hydrogenobaculum sp. SN]